jgi:putative ABC transport system permease protein
MKQVIKSILRNFSKKPVINLINLLGLSVSFSFVIILSVYCYSELNTDNFHKNGGRVYLYGLSEGSIYTPGILKDHIDMKIPGVESTVRISGTWEPPVFQVENKEPIISDLIFADEDFFRLFTYRFIEGTPETSLKDPLTIVITKTLSDKLFDKEKALGRTIKLNNRSNLVISAVIEEPEAASCLSFSAVTSIATRKIVQEAGGEYTEWGWRDFQTFLLLKKGIDPDETGKAILSLFPEEFQKDYRNIYLTPLRKIYFSKFSLLGSSYIISGNKNKILILVFVAVLVLIIALINFINISTSQWQEKIRLTGILKVVGALRSQIVCGILAESFFFFLAALLIAIEIVSTISTFIHSYTGIHFSLKLTYSPGFVIVSLVSILLLSGLFSVIPALKISSSNAVDNLKKTVGPDITRFSFRSIFVTMQFIIAIILISFTMLIQKQVWFGNNNLGFNKKNIIGIKLTEQLSQKKEVLNNLLSEYPEITKVAFTQYYPGKDIFHRRAQLEQNGEEKQLDFDTFSADASALEIIGLQLVKGNFYTDSPSADKGKVLVNETFFREYNLLDPIGSKINMGNRIYEIVGIVKDFHYRPVNQSIASLVINNSSYASYCLANIKTEKAGSIHSTLEKIRTIASELSPSFPVEVNYLDEAIQNMYISELRFRRTFSLLAGCAIVICSLGILAMSLFACQRRVKEIGIRKVNGAKIPEILLMLNKDLAKWVVIAFVIAAPIAWFAMNKWLENFAYKTSISWWIFVLAGIITIGIALLTVSWQSWRAASRNPVEALRYE